MIRRTLVVALIAGLAACAGTSPLTLQYYRLGPPHAATVAALDDTLPAVVLERVTLADYLGQSGLVLQQGEHQLQVSRSHLWAESLNVAIPEALLAALQQSSPAYRYFLRGSDYVPRTDYALRLHFDAFQATDSGEVVAAGRYQLVDVNQDREIMNRQFKLQEALRGDGYPQAVTQLALLLEQVAGLVATDLETAPR